MCILVTASIFFFDRMHPPMAPGDLEAAKAAAAAAAANSNNNNSLKQKRHRTRYLSLLFYM
jgi:hypothetical protein